MCQGRLVIKNPKNSTNNLFYYLILIFYSSTDLRGNTTTKVSLSEIRKESPWRPSLSHKDETRMQVEEFPGHLSQARRSPSTHFGAPLILVNKRQESNETTKRIAWLRERINPAIRAETAEKVSMDHTSHIA